MLAENVKILSLGQINPGAKYQKSIQCAIHPRGICMLHDLVNHQKCNTFLL
jgi:hypothetical protein